MSELKITSKKNCVLHFDGKPQKFKKNVSVTLPKKVAEHFLQRSGIYIAKTRSEKKNLTTKNKRK